MARKSNNKATGSAPADAEQRNELTVFLTPYETIPAQQAPITSRVSQAMARGARLAGDAAVSAARATATTTSRAASNTAKSVTSTAKSTTEAAKSASRAIERAAGLAIEGSASAITNVATTAAQTTARAGATVASAASATLHFVGDLNGDGRFDAEDLRIAKEAIGKVAVELGGEALDLGKATLRHPIVKDAAAAALVGGAVAATLPFVGVPLGAALGAATVLAPGAAGKIIDTTVSSASRVARKATTASKGKRKPRAKTKP